MSFVITHGPLGVEHEVGCESAVEALSIFRDLMQQGAVGVMLTVFEIGDEALALLQLLVEAEKGQISEPAA
ncbi:hypothetical protein [Chenggangzhangella methanolivorans]|jgi:hypothetical protein|uniref:Uncharacterized protein n=1 Tax=Chenggangzhangella methanolivorans TaxID=1437009 RepID=A0A9E6RDV5_9HYPH|nr:hypothetical protein [Chenggangzhangella methanolivorans]QZO02115.1 hypothetical protein K6K41_13095 [Chenggangzhangella methanolivorans]